MSYIGNPVIPTNFVADSFSGDGVTRTFTMSIGPFSNFSMLVFVNNIIVYPSQYSIIANQLTFVTAPGTGSNNVSVRYLSAAGVPYTPAPGSIQINNLASGFLLPLTLGGTGGTSQASAQVSLGVPSTTGAGATGTWGISISGNAATASAFTGTLTSAQVTTALGFVPANLTGANATGIWPIGITGNAATVTAITSSQVTGALGYTPANITGANATGSWGISITGNAATATQASQVRTTTWVISESSGTLFFAANGTNRAKIDSSGNLTVSGNVTAFGVV